MGWETDLVLMTRVLISDIDAPQKYADTYLERVLIAAGMIVRTEVALEYTYTFDISALTISPDPMTVEDTIFQALAPLKSACILTQGEFKQALGQGIKVKDGDSSIDTSVSFRGYRDILELGACKAYDKLRWQIVATGAIGGGVGKAVLGPHRIPGGSAFNTIEWFYDQFVVGSTGRRDR